MKRRDFLKPIGVASVAPGVLKDGESPLTFQGVVLEVRKRLGTEQDPQKEYDALFRNGVYHLTKTSQKTGGRLGVGWWRPPD